MTVIEGEKKGEGALNAVPTVPAKFA